MTTSLMRREYVFDELVPVVEYDYAGDSLTPTQISHYTYGNGRMVLLERAEGGQTESYWYHYDGLGSVVALTDEMGEEVCHWRYDEYGNLLQDCPNLNHYTYTGQEYDPETGLLHFYARYYDASTGVWLSQDTARGAPPDPMTLHRYAYVLDNPLRFTDPTGHYEFEEEPGAPPPPPRLAPPPAPPPTPRGAAARQDRVRDVEIPPTDEPVPPPTPSPTSQESTGDSNMVRSFLRSWRIVQRFVPGMEIRNEELAGMSFWTSPAPFSVFEYNFQLSYSVFVPGAPTSKVGSLTGETDRVEVKVNPQNPIHFETSISTGGTLVSRSPDLVGELSWRLTFTKRDNPLAQTLAGAVMAVAMLPELWPVAVGIGLKYAGAY